MLKIAGIYAALFLLTSSCTGDNAAQQAGSVVGVSPEQTQQVLNAAKKGMTAAHDAHGFAADLALAFVHTGTLHGDNAAKVSSLLKDSETYLGVGDSAIAVGDANGALDAIDKSNALIAQVKALLPH